MVASLINYAFGSRNAERFCEVSSFIGSRAMNKTFESYQPVAGVLILKVIPLLLNYLLS